MMHVDHYFGYQAQALATVAAAVQYLFTWKKLEEQLDQTQPIGKARERIFRATQRALDQSEEKRAREHFLMLGIILRGLVRKI